MAMFHAAPSLTSTVLLETVFSTVYKSVGLSSAKIGHIIVSLESIYSHSRFVLSSSVSLAELPSTRLKAVSLVSLMITKLV